MNHPERSAPPAERLDGTKSFCELQLPAPADDVGQTTLLRLTDAVCRAFGKLRWGPGWRP